MGMSFFFVFPHNYSGIICLCKIKHVNSKENYVELDTDGCHIMALWAEQSRV